MRNKLNKGQKSKQKNYRIFSTAFKKSKVEDILAKRIGVTELSRLYKVSRSSVYKWIHLYSNIPAGVITVVQMESEEQKTKVLMKRLTEYERIIGQKQMSIDLLEKGYELASEELGYDLKKKYVLGHWNGSDETGINMATK